MTARPILFSPSMVAAILDGRKSVTRRIMTPQPVQIDATGGGKIWQYRTKGGGFCNSDYDNVWPKWMTRHAKDQDGIIYRSACPYGAAGDTLWVREEHYRYGHWEPVLGGLTRKEKRQKWRFVPDSEEVLYTAPVEYLSGKPSKTPGASMWHKRLARFMPRSCSRLTLEVLGVGVDRGHVSKADALAEGIRPFLLPLACPDGTTVYAADWPSPLARNSPSSAYSALFEHINGFGTLALWRWAISFRVVATSAATER